MPASSSDSTENGPGQVIPGTLQDACAELDSERSFLTRLLETLPYPVSYIDADLIYRQCNSAAAATVGCTPDQVVGESVASVVGAESKVLDLLREVLSTGEPYSGTVEFTAPGTGSTAIYRASYLPDIDEEGNVIGVLTNVVDVTDLVRGEEALRASEVRLRRIARSGRIGFVEYNVAADEAYWSPEHYELFGFEDGSQVDWQRWLEGVHPEDRERIEANAARMLERAVAEGRVRGHTDEYRFVRPDGTVTWIEADMAVDMVDGQPIVRGAVRDVTEHKRLEEELARQQKELEHLVRHAATGIFEIDFRGPRFLSVNDFMCTNSGYSREELLSMDPMDLLDEESRARFRERISATLAGEAVAPQTQYRFRTKQGEMRYTVLNVTPTYEDGRPVGAFVVGQDVTERKRAEEALRESEEQNAFLLQLTDALRPLADPIAVQETASRLLGEHLKADRAGYFEIDGGDCVIERDWAPSVPHLSGRFHGAAFGEWLVSAYRSGRMVVMNDIAEEPLAPQEREAYAAIGVAAQISIPLIKDGAFVGGLTVHSAAPRVWTPQEMRLLEETAERTWAAVERAKSASELRRSQEALRESESTLRSFFDSHGVMRGIVEVVSEVDVRHVADNEVTAGFLGLSPEAMRNKLGSELGEPEEVLRRWIGYYEESRRTGKPVTFEYADRRGDEEAWLSATVSYLGLNRAGEHRFAYVVRDVTEQKRAEEALKRQAELMDLSFDAMIVWQPGGTIESWNRGAEKLYGFARADALGRVGHDLLATIHERPWPEIEATLREQGVWEGEVRHHTKGGREILVSSRHQLIRGGDGVERVVETNRDITAHRLAEAERELLLEAAGALNRPVELADVLDTLARISLDVGGHSRIVISLWQEERGCLTVARSRGDAALPDGMAVAIEDLSAPARRAIERHETIVIDYDALEPGRRGMGDKYTSHLALDVPIVFGGRFVGLLATDDPGKRREFSHRQVRLIEGLAAHASVAIENARLFEAKEDELNRTAILREVAAAAAGTIDQRELSAQVLDACRRRLGAKAGNVYVIDPDAGVLQASVLFGFPEGLMPQLERMELDEARASARSYLKSEVVMHDSPALPSGISERSKAADASRDRWVSVPIRARNEVLGSLGLIFPGQRAFGADEIALYQALADQLGVALDKARLFEGETAAQVEQAAREERARLARDLHDSVTQSLFAATLKAEALTIAAGDQAPAMTGVAEELGRLNRGALAQMRTMLLELRGDPVEDVPLHQLLRNLVEAAESRASVKVRLDLGEDTTLPADVHEAVYRITQEALNNVTRHAKAQNAWVELDRRASHARLVIRDDGCGFDPDAVEPGHLGLKLMRERVDGSGGQLAVGSVLGEGTVVSVDWYYAGGS